MDTTIHAFISPLMQVPFPTNLRVLPMPNYHIVLRDLFNTNFDRCARVLNYIQLSIEPKNLLESNA
jgi:hypothetical protein